MALLAENRYGKSRVRLIKVTRHNGVHSVVEWSVSVVMQGDYQSCFRSGDNSAILPTDTMKNTVYSLARGSGAACIEDFAKDLVAHFLTGYSQAQSIGIDVEERLWDHLEIDGHPQPTSFQQRSNELQTTSVLGSRDSSLTVTSGLSGLVVLKTADSAFQGYLKDPLTTLRETTDRLLGTEISASWSYDGDQLPFAQLRGEVRAALLAAFARHQSLSVQHTLFAMAEAALAQTPSLLDITLAMPNKHCLLVDLSPFGQDNPNQIFMPIDEPHGSIQAKVTRSEGDATPK